jgi:hypothetical protein
MQLQGVPWQRKGAATWQNGYFPIGNYGNPNQRDTWRAMMRDGVVIQLNYVTHKGQPLRNLSRSEADPRAAEPPGLSALQLTEAAASGASRR